MKKKKRKQLAQLQKAYEQGMLDESTYQAAVAALGGGASESAEVSGSGAVAQSGGVAAGAGGVAVGGDVFVISELSDLGDLAPTIRNQLQQALQRQVQQAPQDAGPQLALGLHYLDIGLYQQAIEALKAAHDIEPRNARILYYLALAHLKGRRPRSLRLFEIEAVERYLEAAIRLDRNRAESLYLWALIKSDFYMASGMRISPPDVEDLVDMAEMAVKDADEIEQMLRHAPVPASPLTEYILDR